MKAEILCSTLTICCAEKIKTRARDHAPWVAEKPKNGGAGVEQLVGLTRWSLQLMSEMTISRRKTNRRQSEPSNHQRVSPREQRLRSVDCVGCLRSGDVARKQRHADNSMNQSRQISSIAIAESETFTNLVECKHYTPCRPSFKGTYPPYVEH